MARENDEKAKFGDPNIRRSLALRSISAGGAIGRSDEYRLTPRSAWRWRAASMTRKGGPPCCKWRRCGFAWQARGSSKTQRKNLSVRAFPLGLLGEPVPGLSHFLHDLTVPLGLGFLSEAATFLRKSPVFR